MFKCLLVLNEVYSDGRVSYEREVELPFAPSTGLYICLSKKGDDSDLEIFNAEWVEYDLESGTFRIEHDEEYSGTVKDAIPVSTAWKKCEEPRD